MEAKTVVLISSWDTDVVLLSSPVGLNIFFNIYNYNFMVLTVNLCQIYAKEENDVFVAPNILMKITFEGIF